jgi:[protein-PII] uridylyltransferase
MADTATRRDLGDASVADNLAAQCAADPERLRLLYLLTVGDSRATGPAAWGASKAALLRDLLVKAAATIERGAANALANDRRDALAERMGAAESASYLARLPESYVLAFDVDEMQEHAQLVAAAGDAPAIRCSERDGHVSVIVVAADRPRLLVTLAGALAISGLDVLEANLFGTNDGLALDAFRAVDPFGRIAEGGVDRVERTLLGALAGELDVDRRVADRRRDYQHREGDPGPVVIEIDVTGSATDTVVEVHVDDEIGLLHKLAAALADLALDVRVAKVATLGKRVVDVFYVRRSDGTKVEDVDDVDTLRAALSERLRA